MSVKDVAPTENISKVHATREVKLVLQAIPRRTAAAPGHFRHKEIP